MRSGSRNVPAKTICVWLSFVRESRSCCSCLTSVPADEDELAAVRSRAAWGSHGVPTGARSEWSATEKFSGTVAGPDDCVEFDDFGEFQLNPASAELAGNPAEVIAVASVIDVRQLMDADVGIVTG